MLRKQHRDIGYNGIALNTVVSSLDRVATVLLSCPFQAGKRSPLCGPGAVVRKGRQCHGVHQYRQNENAQSEKSPNLKSVHVWEIDVSSSCQTIRRDRRLIEVLRMPALRKILALRHSGDGVWCKVLDIGTLLG